MERLGYANLSSVYYLKGRVTTKAIAGRVLFSVAEVEELALEKEEKRRNHIR